MTAARVRQHIRSQARRAAHRRERWLAHSYTALVLSVAICVVAEAAAGALTRMPA